MIDILLIALLAVLVSWLLFRKPKIYSKAGYDSEPTSIEVFPDFHRDMPYEAKLGENLNFHVRGYCDKHKIEEVNLIESDIEWQHQNYIGAFHGGHNERLKGSSTVTYGLPDKEKDKGKLLYVVARYHGLQDTTWIKISEV